MGRISLHMGTEAKILNPFVENEMHHLPMPEMFNTF